MNQIELHKKVDILMTAGVSKASVDDVNAIISANTDARHYFFSRVDDSWFDWLWENNFFDVVKRKAQDATKYSYRTPELNYLAKVAEKNSESVVDFILSVRISSDTFNPEVIDRFLWITSKLPAVQLTRIASKIRDEQWVRLMGRFNRWAFEFKSMFETMAAAKDYATIITLAEVVLTIRTKGEIERTGRGMWGESPFYFQELSYSEVFEYLSSIDEANTEAVLGLVLKTISAIVVLSGEKEDKVFKYGDMYSLYDVDFFTLELGNERHLSSRDDVRDLAAIAKIFASKLIRGSCGKPDEVRRIYEKYIVPLPDARTMWRFRLFIWSLCPEVFKTELKDALFLLFKHEDEPFPIVGGAEYEQALKVGFSLFSVSEQREYVQGIFKLFGDEERPTFWYGVISSISQYLTPEEKAYAEKSFQLPLKDDFEPEPSIGRSYAGTVVAQAPENTEDEWKKSIPEIVELFKKEWAPEELQKIDKRRDFLRPINAEGVADKLRSEMKERLQEYIDNAPLFFDREEIDPHYTYSFLRGINEIIRLDREKISSINWKQLIVLGKAILASGEAEQFCIEVREREKFNAWLAGWRAVHSSLADILEELLRGNGEKIMAGFEIYRGDLFAIISYLLGFPDPDQSDEKLEDVKVKDSASGEQEYQMSDPFTAAINTTRGRAFQALLQFVYQDSKRLPKDSTSKLSEDVRVLYEKVLSRENTRAIMFMFGHYLPFFYYRDQKWCDGMLPKIFIKDESKIDLFLAAWEGYLTASLYTELFSRLQDEYARAISFTSDIYTKRRYRGNLDEALATHLALAYIHFNDFDLKSDLYRAFWKMPNEKRHGTFISFIGRHVISRDSPEKWIAEHKEVSVGKLAAFWDWALANCQEKEALKEFGFWMQAKYKIFEPAWLAEHIDKILEKTGGDVDWELGLVDSLPILAKDAPETTLSILRRYLIEGPTLKQRPGYLRLDKDLRDVLRVLYIEQTTKESVYELINDLLPIGNGQFWDLKEIIKND